MDKEFIENPVEAYEKLMDDYAELKSVHSRLLEQKNNVMRKIIVLYTTLQEIKAIAEECMTKDACFECKYSDDCHIEDAEIPTYDICKLLIQKITKAEEE